MTMLVCSWPLVLAVQGAGEVASLKARLRQALEERDTAVAEKRELEQISAQLLEMVDKK